MAEIQENGAPDAPPSDPTNTAVAGTSVRTAVPGGVGQEATFADVTQAYTTYAQELQSTFDGLRRRAVSIQETAPQQLNELQSQLQPQTRELIEAVTETQAPVATGVGSVVSILLWSSVSLFAAGIASIAGAYLLSPILGVFLGRFGSALLSLVVIPVASFYLIQAKQQAGETDTDIRSQLLSIATVQGLLLGHAVAYTHISGQPLAFLSPLVIAFAYSLVSRQVGGSRIPLLGATLGASFAALLLLGAVSGLLTPAYFVLATLYTASAGAVLQVAFRNIQTNTVQVHLYQLALVSSFLFSKGLVFALFGTSAR
ncbi:unnamed protein product [Caenorhabditis auriculariae]|uniref:Uncharacterized protein n=1 Tax=Caenorhabditis auriculariae TaxID=2777116 RepID=A0A8S1HP44_9PELO|nr:unnamed protein product [Caenorhabditis auriculariae]